MTTTDAPTSTKTQKSQRESQSLNSKGGKAYALAEKKVWDALPPWKKAVVVECRASKNYDDRVYTEFARAIIALAEES